MSISSLFQQDATLLNELSYLLSREQLGLINANLDEIEVVLDDKDRLLQEINASAKLRYQALQNAGFDANEDGMAAWIKKNPQDGNLQLWNEFQACLSHAKELNRVNGLLIQKQFSRNQQMLKQLQISSKDGVYDSNGLAASGSYSRSVISA